MRDDITYPDSKVHGANMGPIWGRQDPGGPMLAPWTLLSGYVMHSLWLWPLWSRLSEQIDNMPRWHFDCFPYPDSPSLKYGVLIRLITLYHLAYTATPSRTCLTCLILCGVYPPNHTVLGVWRIRVFYGREHIRVQRGVGMSMVAITGGF